MDGVNATVKKERVALKWKAMSWRKKSRYLFENITVEPILACYIMPSVLASLAMQNLNLEKACYVNLNYSEHVCVALTERNVNNYTFEETEVQKMVASMVVWKTALQSSLPALLILFFGSWSDRRARRKPYLLLPIVGELLTSLGFLLCTYFFYSWPMEVAGICESLFPALTGGWMTMFMAIFSYIADVTVVKMRTFRIGIVNIFVSLGIPFGTALSGILFRQIGYYGMFSLSTFLYIFGLIYGIVRIKEPLTPIPRDRNVSFLKDFFDMKHIVETSRVVTRKREDGIQCRIILVMVLTLLIIGPLYGEWSVAYLFTRYKFNWNEVNYSMFSTYCVVINLIGSMIAIGLLSRFFGMDDTTIGALACLGKIASSFVFAFSQSQLIFFLAPLLDMINDAGHIAVRSMATKLVPPEEQAKMNSLLGVCEAIAPLIYGPLYSFVYTQTITRFPGAFLLLGAALTFPAFVIFVNLYFMKDRQKILNAEQDENEEKELSEKLIGIKSEDSLNAITNQLQSVMIDESQTV